MKIPLYLSNDQNFTSISTRQRTLIYRYSTHRDLKWVLYDFYTLKRFKFFLMKFSMYKNMLLKFMYLKDVYQAFNRLKNTYIQKLF